MSLKSSPVASHARKLQALCTLSNLSPAINVAELVRSVSRAPDPETAVRMILNSISLPSEVLERKWRSTIVSLWAKHHPHVPLLPSLTLASDEVAAVPLLRDAHAYLQEIRCQPALLREENGEVLLQPADVWRLAAALPSLKGSATFQVESEWAYLTLRRLRAALQALRLVRPVKGKLVVVRSRYERFKAFPSIQQFYVLWHADTYHVDWGEFAGIWGKFTRVIQDYLPLLWDLGEHLEAGQRVDRAAWCGEVLETFAPLWDEEGLLNVGQGHAAILPILQQHALPTILDKFLVRDVLQRHGAVALREEFGQLSSFTWTAIGARLFKVELTQELPCGLELLSPHFSDVVPDHNDRFID